METTEEKIVRLEKRIDQLKTEIIMGNYYDGWSLEGMKKELTIIEDRLRKLKEN